MSDDGVFSKTQVDYGTLVLLETAKEEDVRGNVLDLGCGYGVIGVVLAKEKTEVKVLSSDINPRAVELAKINYQKNGVTGETRVSNVFDEIPECFDWIFLNPPIRTGKANIYYMFDEAYKHLTDCGSLVIVIRRKQGAESALKKLQSVYQKVDVIAKDRGYWVIKATRTQID